MLEPGQVVDEKYKIVRPLGQGGMGAVYEALHLNIKRRVAVKVILDDRMRLSAEAMARFRREASAAGRIETQHIVQVLDTGEDPGTGYPYMVMELLQGVDLDGLLTRLGPLPPELVLRILAQSLLGLAKAHDAGVIHRDIKPGNLFVANRDAGEVVVKVLDFGIAKTTGEDQQIEAGSSGITRTGVVMGSLDYLSPEQAMGARDLDFRSDVFSLGAAAYRALCGHTPGDQYDNVGRRLIAICQEHAKHLQDEAPWVPKSVAAMVHKALQIEPGRRFQSAMEWFEFVSLLLPDGWTIHQRMLRPLSDEERSRVCPRLGLTPLGSIVGTLESICREEQEAEKAEAEAASRAQAPAPAPARNGFVARKSPQASTGVIKTGKAQTGALPATPSSTTANLGVFGRLESVYSAAGRWDQLTDLYESKIRSATKPADKVELYRRMARVYGQKMRNKERAFATLLAALQLDYCDSATLEQVERLAEETSRWSELTATAERWMQSENEPARILQLSLQLSKWHVDHGHSHRVRPLLDRAVSLAGEDVAALRQLASTYQKIGELEIAAGLLAKALNKTTDTSERVALSTELGALSQDLDDPKPIQHEHPGLGA